MDRYESGTHKKKRHLSISISVRIISFPRIILFQFDQTICHEGEDQQYFGCEYGGSRIHFFFSADQMILYLP